MFYIETWFTFFPYIMEAEDLALIWNVLVGPQSLVCDRSKISITIRWICCCRCILPWVSEWFRRWGKADHPHEDKILQSVFIVRERCYIQCYLSCLAKRHFVIVEFWAYHGVFDTEYNVAKVTNFADFSWIEPSWGVSREHGAPRLFNQCVLPFELILGQEVETFFSFGDHQGLLRQTEFVKNLAKELSRCLQLYVRRAKRKLKPNSSSDCGRKELLSSHSSELSQRTCFTCKCDAFLFVQLFLHCESQVNTLFINHLRTTNSICNVSGHRDVIYLWFPEGELEEKIDKLRIVETNRKKLDDDGRMIKGNEDLTKQKQQKS